VLLLEIAAQGVRGVSPAGGSARLRPAYNVCAFDGPALRRLVLALLYPADPDGAALRAGAPAGAAVRGGITLVGADGATYRLLRDFAAGCGLHRFDPAKRAFTPVATDAARVAEALQGPVGIPPRRRLELLSLAASELPSRRAGAGLGAAAATPMPRRALSAPAKEKRLAELHEELARAVQAEKAQYALDGLQTRFFKLEELLKEGARLREGAEAADAALAAAGPAAAVAARLGDLDAKLAAHAKAVAKRDEGTARVEADRALIDGAEAVGAPRPFWTEARFWAGVGGGMAAAAGAALGAGATPGLRYLALLDIPAFGASAWIALRWVGALEEHGRLGRRRKLMEEHERKVLEAFERDPVVAELRAAAKELGVANLAELQESLRKVADAAAAARDARERLAAFEARPETRATLEERTRVEVELKQAEAALAAEAGGWVRDPRSVEMELERLAVEPAAPGEEPPAPAPPPAAPAASSPDPMRELMERAAVELGVSPAAAVREVQARASQLVQALSAGRLGGVGVDDRGNLLAQAAGRSGPAAALAPAERDLVWLALKLAVVERVLAAGKGLALFEDPFAALPEAVRRATGRLLKQLARPGQLLHASADAAFRESADHVV
jgi:hypothetical protein